MLSSSQQQQQQQRRRQWEGRHRRESGREVGRQSRIFHRRNISHDISSLPSDSQVRDFHPVQTDWQPIFHQPADSSQAPATVYPSLNDCDKSFINPHIFLPYFWWQLIIPSAVNVCVHKLGALISVTGLQSMEPSFAWWAWVDSVWSRTRGH